MCLHLAEEEYKIADDRDGSDPHDVAKDQEEGLLGRHAEARAVDGRLIGVRTRHRGERIRCTHMEQEEGLCERDRNCMLD